MMATTGERIATLEEKAVRAADDIESLRETRHEHANMLQKHEARIEQAERAVQTMDKVVVPAIRTTLETQAEEIRKIRAKTQKQGIDFGWVMRILIFVVMVAQAVITGVMIDVVKNAMAKPAAVAAPATRGK